MSCEIFFFYVSYESYGFDQRSGFCRWVITFLQLSDLCYHYTRHILTTYISTKEKNSFISFLDGTFHGTLLPMRCMLKQRLPRLMISTKSTVKRATKRATCFTTLLLKRVEKLCFAFYRPRSKMSSTNQVVSSCANTYI